MSMRTRPARPYLYDSIGRPITLNHQLAYPVRKGANMWMESGVVKSVDMDTGGLFARLEKEDGKVVKFRNFQRSVIV